MLYAVTWSASKRRCEGGQAIESQSASTSSSVAREVKSVPSEAEDVSIRRRRDAWFAEAQAVTRETKQVGCPRVKFKASVVLTADFVVAN